MNQFDPDPEFERLQDEISLRKKTEAMLYATLGVIFEHSPELFAKIAWNEYGITNNEFTTWWNSHRAIVEEHQSRVANQKRINRLKASIKSKLTDEELEILNLK